MVLLSPVLSTADLPEAELRAARLDGELYPLAGAWCPIGELEGAAHRCRAILADRSPRFIVELTAAAWVWGAADLPAIPTLAVTPDSRARVGPSEPVRVREVVLDPGDVATLTPQGHRVTTPLRTLVDLARRDDDFDPSTVARLAAIARLGLGDALALLEARPGIPGKKVATARLRAAL